MVGPTMLFYFYTTAYTDTPMQLAKVEFFATSPDPEDPSAYVDFHAFAANLHERRIHSTRPTWAIWVQCEAHEDPRPEW